jgi:hypothetical protein
MLYPCRTASDIEKCLSSFIWSNSKHDDVCFPAVYAGVVFKVGVYIGTDTTPGSFAVLFGLGDNLITMLRIVPAARFPSLLYVAERHGWGVYDEYYKIKTPGGFVCQGTIRRGVTRNAGFGVASWKNIGGGGLWFRIPSTGQRRNPISHSGGRGIVGSAVVYATHPHPMLSKTLGFLRVSAT